MVHFLQCCCRSLHMPLGTLVFSIFVFFLLIITSSMETTFSDARTLPLGRRLLEIEDAIKQQEEVVVAAEQPPMAAETTTEQRRRSLMIGSRPPRCEKKKHQACTSSSCGGGHCEAVQVPVVPQQHRHRKKKRRAAAAHQEQEQVLTVTNYRTTDGVTNYKPLSWKCRCGGAILDP